MSYNSMVSITKLATKLFTETLPIKLYSYVHIINFNSKHFSPLSLMWPYSIFILFGGMKKHLHIHTNKNSHLAM